ncbi:type VI secretion system lipoprotein TssJ [Herbaspirillum sp. LeCh32-8]|uniref:type VI secretion system lipoprotein TssJ n=1 Tax=Herbaspirillum sp. LeCh32-8 TaxID=2821356 RepID=UPI001AE7143C|nr:type VI secretion system lipoprotein TssJ [Herbaspirillum sp. LeCh32-8]MBP0596736.1 type VI secretion system lipoprotein TssJ [Herbaspirillum sp. LeCh32-8]
MPLRLFIALLLSTLITGCSTIQTLSDATTNAYRTVFSKKQEMLTIGIVTDNTANPDRQGRALSVVTRIYQLRDRQAFDQADYATLLKSDRTALAYDALSADTQTVSPNTGTRLSMPLSQATQYVGVVAFFRITDKDDAWKLVVDRKTLLSRPALMLDISEYTIRVRDQ